MINCVINVKKKGKIYLELREDIAPKTVTNFIFLAISKYYDNIFFHRVIKDFMIQGGDRKGLGYGNPGYYFEDEFKKDIIFDRKGILAMANSGPNSNGSQFFITHVLTPWLNYRHTIFGYVKDDTSQEIVNTIDQGDVIENIEILDDYLKLFEDNKDFLNYCRENIEFNEI